MRENEIKRFWEAHPCGDQLIGGLESGSHRDCLTFFNKYDAYRYRTEPHILEAIDRFDFRGKKVLEVGLGQGADSEQLIRRGALWSGIDLTQESVSRVRMRLSLRNLPFDDLSQASVLKIPHEDGKFDVVFSHGVLMTVPEIGTAQKEIGRVLKPDGSLIVMLYSKNSLNYYLSICVLRRVGLIGLYYSGIRPGGIYNDHLDNAAKIGLWKYLKMDHFIHKSTDGPFNPYVRVYTLEDVRREFVDFEIVDHFKMWMHAPPLSSDRWPGGRWLGWHLWVHLKTRR